MPRTAVAAQGEAGGLGQRAHHLPCRHRTWLRLRLRRDAGFDPRSSRRSRFQPNPFPVEWNPEQEPPGNLTALDPSADGCVQPFTSICAQTEQS